MNKISNNSARLLLISLFVTGMVGCEDEPPQNGRTPQAAQTVPFASLPQDTKNIRDLVKANQTPGIQAQFIGQDQDELLVLQIDPQLLEPVLIGQPSQGISAADAMLDNEFSAIIGSGFVAELHSLDPVGLLQIEGEVLSPVQGHGYTRILGVNDNGMGVIHRETYQRGIFHSAMQVGPGIIERGMLDISERDLQRPKYFRSFVAVCENQWLIGVSLAPTHLRTLGQVLLEHMQQQNLQCSDVVNLAGDKQAIMMVRTDGETTVYHGEPSTYKVSLLGFRPPPK